MDPPATDPTRRRSSGRGGKTRQTRLGLKKPAIPTPAATQGLLVAARPTSSSDALHAMPAASPSSSVARSGAPGVPTSSLPAATSSIPPQPPQGGWGAMFPNFPSQHGNQQGSNPWIYPPGGFQYMLNQQNYPHQPQVQEENFHMVGQNIAFNPISPSSAYGTPSPQATRQGTSTNNIVIDDDGDIATNKAVLKRYWTHEEEERLASSWLEASKDPIQGNEKKGDTFWKKVTAEFNRKGNGKRTREFNQLKIHWSRLKSSIGEFNDCWTSVTKMHTSGYSDDMLEEEAQKMHANRFGKRFQLVHWWKILKDEPKWCALFEKEKDKTEEVDIPEGQMRPGGREAAKAERSGKRKKTKCMEVVVGHEDTLEKIAKVQEDRKVEFEKAAAAQIQISEANLKAAKEEKEARMFQVYNTLLSKDTSTMSESQKANHERAIHKLEEKLFAE